MSKQADSIGTMVTLSYCDRPSGREILHLARLAEDFNGSLVEDVSNGREWLFHFFFGRDFDDQAAEFENRALMFQDIMERGN